jgi:hypothetical protein
MITAMQPAEIQANPFSVFNKDGMNCGQNAARATGAETQFPMSAKASAQKPRVSAATVIFMRR